MNVRVKVIALTGEPDGIIFGGPSGTEDNVQISWFGVRMFIGHPIKLDISAIGHPRLNGNVKLGWAMEDALSLTSATGILEHFSFSTALPALGLHLLDEARGNLLHNGLHTPSATLLTGFDAFGVLGTGPTTALAQLLPANVDFEGFSLVKTCQGNLKLKFGIGASPFATGAATMPAAKPEKILKATTTTSTKESTQCVI